MVNPLPNNKILDWCKLKASADNKINLNEKLKLVLGRIENIGGKGENAGYQHVLLFPPYFQKPSPSGSLKVGIVRLKSPLLPKHGSVIMYIKFMTQ